MDDRLVFMIGLFKLIILGWRLPGLLQGLSASLNYATGFVAIQLSTAVGNQTTG